MESLEAYHSGYDSELRSAVKRLEILSQRGLYDHCDKLLIKAKKASRKYEKYLQLIEILSIEVEIWYRRTFSEKTEKEIKLLFEEIEQTVNIFNNHLQYRYLNAKLIHQMAKSGPITDSNQEENINIFLKDALLQSDKMAISLKAKLTYYNCLAFYYDAISDFEKKLDAIMQIDKLMEMHPETIEIHPYFYLTNIGNIISCFGMLNRFSEMQSVLNKMIQTKTLTPELKVHQYFIHRNLLVSMYTRTGRIDEGIQALKETESDIDSGKVIMPSRYIYLLHLYYAAYHYFSAGDYIKSNAFIQKITDNYVDDTGFDFQCFAINIRLFIQFETGKPELLVYTTKSVSRFILKKKIIYKIEESLLRFFKRNADIIQTEKQIKAELFKLQNEIAIYSNDKYQARAMEYFNVSAWIESKINNTTFSETLKLHSALKK